MINNIVLNLLSFKLSRIFLDFKTLKRQTNAEIEHIKPITFGPPP